MKTSKTNKLTILSVFAAAIIALLLLGVAGARPDTSKVGAANGLSGKALEIPANAVQVAENVFSLGQSVDVDGKMVDGFMIIDYKKGAAKPGSATSGATSTCYAFMAKGAKWKTNEPWVLNPANSHGLNGSFLFSNVDYDISKWELAANKNIFGSGALTSSALVADEVSPDGSNELYFGSIADPGVIAVTIVWGRFSGPMNQRQLVEWDQVYDDADFGWSATGEPGKMDFENIATHEIGHAFGLSHPSSTCAEETMYAYADFGETKKRSLNPGDIQGIKALYP